MIFLHGILGRRVNWRSFARRWVDRMPGWGAVLVDLRLHGDSQDSGDSQGLAGPHDLASASADVVELARAIELEHGGRIAALLGHSFGGKVAIGVADALRAEARGLERLWVLDAPPGPRTQPRDRTTEQVFTALAELPGSFVERREFIEALVERSIARPVAQWLATNLVAIEGPSGEVRGWRFGLDLVALRGLLDDFMVVDAWPALERVADAGTEVCLVLGGASQAVFGEQREHADRLACAGRIGVIEIPGAGHWVHVDQPAALLDLLVAPPPTCERGQP